MRAMTQIHDYRSCSRSVMSSLGLSVQPAAVVQQRGALNQQERARLPKHEMREEKPDLPIERGRTQKDGRTTWEGNARPAGKAGKAIRKMRFRRRLCIQAGPPPKVCGQSVQTAAEFDVYGDDDVGRRDDCMWPTSNCTYINVYLQLLYVRYTR